MSSLLRPIFNLKHNLGKKSLLQKSWIARNKIVSHHIYELCLNKEGMGIWTHR